VQAVRGKVAAAATAWVDRDVVGFRPQGLNPLPVMPLAILSDPFGPPESADNESWEWNIEARMGTHHWLCDPKTKMPRKVKAGERDDRIPEITVCFTTEHGKGNGRCLGVGEGTGDMCRQALEGLCRDDLLPHGGELSLPVSKPLHLPHLKVAKRELEQLAETFRMLEETGERRIWMLYSPRFDAKRGDGAKVCGVVGFVAAQVMNVQLDKGDKGDKGKGRDDKGKGNSKDSYRLRVVLQPGMRITDTAITEAARRNDGPRLIWNPYVCRVRLVE
jgi:hypothetical protein